MKRYQYKETAGGVEVRNALGLEGWECFATSLRAGRYISVGTYEQVEVFHFRREIQVKEDAD
jgi:hypothetical protein